MSTTGPDDDLRAGGDNPLLRDYASDVDQVLLVLTMHGLADR